MTDEISTTHFRAIHQQMRLDTRRIASAIETSTSADRDGRLRPFAKYAAGFARELHLHHVVEDHHIFPAVVERLPAVGAVLDGLAQDHEVVDGILARWTPAARRLADRRVSFDDARDEMLLLALELRDLLARHLDIEDERIVPAIPDIFTVADYDELQRHINRSLPKRGLSFAIPWNVEALPVDERPSLIASAPLILRILYRLNVGRFRRLTAAAFDGVPALV